MEKKKTKVWDVLVVGGGASGLMAAVTAARAGKKVLILEQKPDIGKKILATGNGKCNFTNEFMDASCFFGNKELIAGILAKFDKDASLSFFHELGIYPKEKNGYYYPNSETAVSVVEAFRQELSYWEVSILTDCKVEKINPKYVGFELDTTLGVYKGKHLILATGLFASPKLGSDGSLMNEIKHLGHSFMPVVPALCGFHGTGLPFSKISGVRVRGEVAIELEGRMVGKDTGEIQLADYGISGIPVFQISRIGALGLYEKKSPVVHINFLPDMTREELHTEIQYRLKQRNETKKAKDLLNGLLNGKLSEVLLEKAKIEKETPVSSLNSKEIERLCTQIQDTKVTLTKSRGFEYAQVCAGGIKTSDIDIETLESKCIPNLYFTGELLDVDGICGGYNLQWAWATGYVAGTAVSENRKS